MGTQFLLTLPNDFSISSHSAQLGGGGEEDLLVKIDTLKFSPLNATFRPITSLFFANL